MFKAFYIHQNIGSGKISGRSPRGFTLRVAPSSLDDKHVVVSGAWCSHKDEFVKKSGRKVADEGEQVTINKRNLPDLAASMSNTVHGEELFTEHNFYYLLKYVI